MEPVFLDISPNQIYTSDKEPCSIKNKVALEIRNPSTTETVKLLNDKGKVLSHFSKIEDQQEITDVSLIYFVFPLGSSSGCFSTEEQFQKVEPQPQQGFTVARPYPGYIVLYPAKTMEIPPCGQAELVLDSVITSCPVGSMACCTVKFFNIALQTFSVNPPVYRTRHPLRIQKFLLEPDTATAAFRDELRFSWLVLGADSCIFTPGDVIVDQQCPSTTMESYQTMLLKRTLFTLVARCGKEQVSQILEVNPLQAEITAFDVEKECQGDKCMVKIEFAVKNTRHAFLTHVGRIDAISGEKMTVTIEQTYPKVEYTLSVENENGLDSRSAVVEK